MRQATGEVTFAEAGSSTMTSPCSPFWDGVVAEHIGLFCGDGQVVPGVLHEAVSVCVELTPDLACSDIHPRDEVVGPIEEDRIGPRDGHGGAETSPDMPLSDDEVKDMERLAPSRLRRDTTSWDPCEKDPAGPSCTLDGD